VAKKIYLKFGKSAYIVPVMLDIASNSLNNGSGKTWNKANVGSCDDDYKVRAAEISSDSFHL
jgi:hypothetical protein